MRTLRFTSLPALLLFVFAAAQTAGAQTAAAGSYQFTLTGDKYLKYVEFDATGKDDGSATGYISMTDEAVITIQDVIAAMGPRVPDVDHAQKQFNTAMVVVTEHGKPPSRELLTAATNISSHWIAYWSKVTGGRASMTVSPR